MSTRNQRPDAGAASPVPPLAAVSLAAVLLATAVALSGCAPAVPSDPPGITGTVTSLTPGEADTLMTILVEVPDGETPDPSFVSDKASVRITTETDVFDIGGNPADAGDVLRPGIAVSVWFTGAVAESYPVQGTASAVRQMP